ncbi:MAG: hypothetical protein MK086_12195 [Flavobacteriales bacterium]|nr:hypothetical protein [Flavobacteriales bacterium]
MDRLFLSNPTLGVFGIQDELIDLGHKAGYQGIRKLLHKMSREAIYPKKNLSKRGKVKYIRVHTCYGERRSNDPTNYGPLTSLTSP